MALKQTGRAKNSAWLNSPQYGSASSPLGLSLGALPATMIAIVFFWLLH